MSIVVVLALKAKADQYETLKATMQAILPDTIAFEGCLGVEAGFNDADQSMLLYERWETKAAQEKYLGWRTETGALEALGAMLREPPVFTDYAPLNLSVQPA